GYHGVEDAETLHILLTESVPIQISKATNHSFRRTMDQRSDIALQIIQIMSSVPTVQLHSIVLAKPLPDVRALSYVVDTKRAIVERYRPEIDAIDTWWDYVINCVWAKRYWPDELQERLDLDN